ncbi:MAG: YfcC family protein [Eubacterium sp.]
MDSDKTAVNLEKTSKKKKREVPHILIILSVMIVIATILTWIIPAGQYDRVEQDGRTVVDPDSFKYVERSGVNPFDMFVHVEEGLIGAANITFLIFAAFSAIYVLQETGAIDAAIAKMVKNAKAHPKNEVVILVVIMVVLAIWGSTGTISYEEIVAFVPIFVSIALALGYDPLVGVGISVVPVGVGFASATVNPFTIGVAQTIAELPMFSGIGYRWLILVCMTALAIGYVLVYARRVRKDPAKSLMYGEIPTEMEMNEEKLNTEMTKPRLFSLIALLVAIIFMAWGLLTQGWYINQCAAIFMILTVAVGIINRWSPNKTASTYVVGLSKGVLSALIVGYARAILTIMQAGNIVDTIIHWFVSILENLSLYASAFFMLIFQTLLNFLIPSGSGQAAVSMPIMTPIADLIGMNRQIAVLIFQFGDGFSNLIIPTGFMVIACVLGKIPLGKYYKWIMPFFGLCFILQVIFVFAAVGFGYN